MAETRCCVTVDLEGILQGVGLRPTVHRLAVAAGLDGWVQNRSGRVRLRLAGPPAALWDFLDELPGRLPPRARLDEMTIGELEPCLPGCCPAGFEIRASEPDPRPRVSIPADLAACPACLAEVFDPASRYHGYPFTTCTDCGPRYTVVDAMPYDRERTALAAFPLCEACRAEYEDPASRRYHAESIACARCGPRLAVWDADGAPLADDPLRTARAALAAGAIVAVRGLGGFLLAVDAFDREAIARLRERKARPHKPLALMAADAATAAEWCAVPPAAAELMASPSAPILVLDPLPDAAERGLPVDLVNPDAASIGVMLPTTPLHALLARPLPGDPTPAFPLLVMTSGNRRGEPICTGNEEARERLAGIADLFVVHDRPIRLRNDDSVAALVGGAPQLWRRARGFAPAGLRLRRPLARAVLAMGAELKSTIALGFGQEVVLSPHVGDLATPEAVDGLAQVVDRLPVFLDQQPAAVAVDLHPDMHSTRLGRRLAARLERPVVEVQHHHAHAAAALAEHGLERGLALVFDGTGLGPDGTIWGGELLAVDREGYRRLGTLAGVPLPGGDAAVERPARQLLGRWIAAGLEPDAHWPERLGASEQEVHVWALQCRRGLHAPVTHAAGRLFDAFAAGLGAAPGRITYEAQPAVRLEALARRAGEGSGCPELPAGLEERAGRLELDWAETFRRLATDPPGAADRARWALGFHRSLARWAVRLALAGRERWPADDVVLTGGVFVNRILAELLLDQLTAAGLRPHMARSVPPGDGGIALGQAVVAGGVSD
jgi:hydrogenase maturation protein HypF